MRHSRLTKVAWLVAIAGVPIVLFLPYDACQPTATSSLSCLLESLLAAGGLLVWAFGAGIVAYWAGRNGAVGWSIATVLAVLTGAIIPITVLTDYNWAAFQPGDFDESLLLLGAPFVAGWLSSFVVVRVRARNAIPGPPPHW